MNTLIYRMVKRDGSTVDEMVDMPETVTHTVRELMRMHDAQTASAVGMLFTDYTAPKPLSPLPELQIGKAPRESWLRRAARAFDRRPWIAAILYGLIGAMIADIAFRLFVR